MPPRPVLKNKTYLVTRRCSDRRFFLRPSKTTNHVVTYLLGLAASRYKIQFHAWIAMSNHIHLVLTDVEAKLPDAMHLIVLQISKSVGAEIGRWGSFWEDKRYSRVELIGPPSVIRKIVYTVTNGVAAGGVRRAERWPGATSACWSYGQRKKIFRPKSKYMTGKKWDAFVHLQLVPPPGLTKEQAEAAIAPLVRHREKAKARLMRMKKDGSKFLGEAAILAQDPFDSPQAFEKRRGRNPTFASEDKWARVEAAQRKREWEQAYRQALIAYRNGNRGVRFPAGTWAMVQLHNCACANQT